MAEKLQCSAVPYLRPPKKSFKHFFYEHETKAVFGRTGSSWEASGRVQKIRHDAEALSRPSCEPGSNRVSGKRATLWPTPPYEPLQYEVCGGRPFKAKILSFYFVFYTVLAAMFAIMLWVFFQTLNAHEPRWKLESSLIGTNPGMGFRPHPPGENVESTLIWYKGSDKENFQYWIDALANFLEVYRRPGLTPGRGQNIYNCDYDRPPNRGQVCDVDVKNWHPCTQENSFNYHKSGPCIFLKLNKIYGWRPDYYNDTKDLPESMPEDLQEHIATQKALDPKLLNTIWVSCQGENPLDRENIGPIHYIPRNRGFPGYFYPFENNEGYLSPLLAIHLERPKTGVLINIECKAWAKNIIHNQKEKLGSVHIELQID